MFNFDSHTRAESVPHAIRLLQENPRARLIAGGTDVLINLREGKEEFRHLVDIHDVLDIKHVTLADNGDIVIGSGTTFTALDESTVIPSRIPMLAETVLTFAGPQLRNMATIGGNICNGMTSADSAPPLFALNAVLTLEGPEGRRDVSIEDFYKGPGRVAIEHPEVLTAITVTRDNYLDLHGCYYKYAMRDAMDIATIGCAGLCKLEGGVIEDLRIAYGVAAPVPVRCKKAETFAKGKKISKDLLAEIAELVPEDLKPRSSWRASKEFRLHIIKTLAFRVIETIVVKAGGQIK
jgi:xanthine dehydrogenase FAD-binding subunit